MVEELPRRTAFRFRSGWRTAALPRSCTPREETRRRAERVEIFGGGATCVIENFRTLEWSRNGRRRRKGGMFSPVDRGHRAEMSLLLECVASGRPFPVPLEEYLVTTRTTFAAVASLSRKRPIVLGEEGGDPGLP
jgi:predicted dehydrogenase